MPGVPMMYSLTKLTRDAQASRTTTVASFEVRKRLVAVALAAIVLSLPIMAVLWAYITTAALITPAILYCALYILIERRARSGLQLRTYQSLSNKRRSSIGQFINAGVVVDPLMSYRRAVVPSSVLVAPRDTEDLIDLAVADRVFDAPPVTRTPAQNTAVPAASGSRPTLRVAETFRTVVSKLRNRRRADFDPLDDIDGGVD